MADERLEVAIDFDESSVDRKGMSRTKELWDLILHPSPWEYSAVARRHPEPWHQRQHTILESSLLPRNALSMPLINESPITIVLPDFTLLRCAYFETLARSACTPLNGSIITVSSIKPNKNSILFSEITSHSSKLGKTSPVCLISVYLTTTHQSI